MKIYCTGVQSGYIDHGPEGSRVSQDSEDRFQKVNIIGVMTGVTQKRMVVRSSVEKPSNVLDA